MLLLLDLAVLALLIWFVIARWEVIYTFRPKWMGGKFSTLAEYVEEVKKEELGENPG